MSKVSSDISTNCDKYFHFITKSEIAPFSYKFSTHSTPSAFSLCFAIFGLNLINRLSFDSGERDLASKHIRNGLDELRSIKLKHGIDLSNDKSYLQLLSFSLTALKIMGGITQDPLDDHCIPLITENVSANLDRRSVNLGAPQSGNYAMFMAVILIHATKYLNIDQSARIEEWLEYHFRHMNRFGFWGDDKSMSHLQFQNGYHQYEIIHYLGAKNPLADNAADAVASLADARFRFAPYPGGGGCYDYDAVAIMTASNKQTIRKNCEVLSKTSNSILQDQNHDGGFCESKLIRPRSINNLINFLKHATSVKGKARRERVRYALTLQRPKHDRVNGAEHWTKCGYQREWNESNLWDSYFRMSAVACIDKALNSQNPNKWNFVDYPGIGFHESSRKQT